MVRSWWHHRAMLEVGEAAWARHRFPAAHCAGCTPSASLTRSGGKNWKHAMAREARGAKAADDTPPSVLSRHSNVTRLL